ncbi:hypothetical protein GF362_01060 [Candidatus Dojkabacteria bacterium]|nr:hypothetical protein [Candidatus Dojkabacteria bacterium]
MKLENKNKILPQFISLFSFALALTILFLSMRAVMKIGGYCAEGGPYVITVHCPKGISILMPLSIFLLIPSFSVYGMNKIDKGPNYTILFWSFVFALLGWNFLEFGILGTPDQRGIVIGWLICAFVFFLFGLGPIILFGPKKTLSFLVGYEGDEYSPKILPFTKERMILVTIHILALITGIILGILLFIYFT